MFPNCTGNHGIALVHPTVLEPARMRCRSTDARHQLLCDGQTARHILPSLSLLTATLQCLQVHAMRRESPALLRVPVRPRKSSTSTQKDRKEVSMWPRSHMHQRAWPSNCPGQAPVCKCPRLRVRHSTPLPSPVPQRAARVLVESSARAARCHCRSAVHHQLPQCFSDWKVRWPDAHSEFVGSPVPE